MKLVQLLRNKGYSVRAEEESLRARLETLDRELSRSFVFRGRLLEMYTQVRSLHDSVQYSKQEGVSVINESSLNAVLEVCCFEKLTVKTLQGQQSGLSHLTDILKKDQKEVELVQRGYAASLSLSRK